MSEEEYESYQEMQKALLGEEKGDSEKDIDGDGVEDSEDCAPYSSLHHGVKDKLKKAGSRLADIGKKSIDVIAPPMKKKESEELEEENIVEPGLKKSEETHPFEDTGTVEDLGDVFGASSSKQEKSFFEEFG